MSRLGALFLAALVSSAAGAAPAPAAVAPPAPLQVTGRVAGVPRAALAETTVELVLLPGGPDTAGRRAAGAAPRAGATPATTATPAPLTAKPRPDGAFTLAAPVSGLYRIRVTAPGATAWEIPTLPLVEDVELPPLRQRRERPAGGPRGEELRDWWMPAEPEPAAAVRPSGAAPVQLGARPAIRGTDNAPSVDWTGRESFRALAGQVLDAARRQPLGGAVVWCPTCPVPAWTRSGADGGFRLLVATAGQLSVRAAAADHVAATLWQPEPGRPVALLLAPSAALGGVVVDGDGRPVAGAAVRAEPRADHEHWAGAIEPPPAAVTGPEGRFRLAGLAAGQLYELAARHDDHAPARLLARAPAPGVQAPPLRLVLSPGRSLVGRVVDADGQPIAGAEVTLWQTLLSAGGYGPRFVPPGGLRAASDAGGRFQLRHLASGDYELRAARQGFAEEIRQGVTVPEGVGEVDVGDLVLERGVVLEGRVVGPKGAAVEGASIAVRPRIDDLRLFHRGQEQRDARTDAGGLFRVADLRRGARVEVTVSHPDFAEADVAEVEVPPTEPLLIELRAMGALAVRVLDAEGEPLPGASVGSFVEHQVSFGGGAPAHAMSSYAGYGETGEDGSLVVRVGAGPLNLLVSAPGYEERRLPGVDVPAGREGQIEVALRPQARAALVGRVTDEAGQLLAGFRIEVEPVDGEGPGWPGGMHFRDPPITDGEGSYRIDGLAAGSYRVTAHGPGQRSASGRVTLGAAGTRRLDLVVAGGTEVGGLVLDGEGRPIGGASVQLHKAPDVVRWATTAADGSFLVDWVPDGTYRLIARASGFAEGEGPEVEVAGAPVTGLEVRLRKAAGRITGRLLGLEPAEVPYARVRAMAPGRSPLPGEVQPDGRYRIDGVAAGEWEVTAGVEAGAVASGKVALAEGQSEAVLDLELPPGAALGGRVLFDGAPVGAMHVSARGPRQAFTRTGHDGSFRLRRLAPGSYTLVLLAEGQGLGWARAVEVGSEDVELAIDIESGSLSGRVTAGATGAPLEGAVVTLEGSDPRLGLSFSGPAVRTDAGGLFELPRLGPGGYLLKVEADGFAPLESRIEIPAGGGVQVELPLAQAGGRPED
jgi:protocatechuate 3,4-dioxygenase beta subunit